jgi:hypothetical protein
LRQKAAGRSSVRENRQKLCWERTTYREGTWGIARNRPTPAPVQCCSFLDKDPDGTTAAKRVRVDLALDLERVKWEEDYLANTRQAACSRLHHHLALPFAERIRKVRPVVPHKNVINPWLATKLVDPL